MLIHLLTGIQVVILTTAARLQATEGSEVRDLALSALRAVAAPVSSMSNSGQASGASSAEQVVANFPLALLLSTLAGASTGLGGLLIVAQLDLTTKRLGLLQGAAGGFMLSVSLTDMLPTALEDLFVGVAIFYMALGALCFLALRRFIPEPDLDAFASRAFSKDDPTVTRSVLWSGLITAIGISLHNFPEGIALCVASVRGLHVGLPLAVAIALHNIPEGICVAMPIYFATESKSFAVKLAFLSGMAEPLGVIAMTAAVHSTGMVLTKAAVSAMLSAVAGVMIIISVVELVPQARQYAGKSRGVLSTVASFICMTGLLQIIAWSGVLSGE
jgi:zinc transporter, ZIP family